MIKGLPNARLKGREATFSVRDGILTQTVTAEGGKGYTHHCDLETFEAVAWAVEETPAEGKGTSLIDIAKQESIPFTRVNVTLEFLKERGIVDVRHRRSYPVSKSPHLDAMTEFHALAVNA